MDVRPEQNPPERELKNSTAAVSPTSTSKAPTQQLRGMSYEEGAALLAPPPELGSVQQKRPGAQGTTGVHEAAQAGTQGAGGSLPHLGQIQAAFGAHDVTSVQSYAGGAATHANRAMGAEAYATGNKIAFGGTPSLHTAAHEAAHVVQQRGGVSLSGGVGQAGDSYENHADAVADAVVAGKSAEGLLNTMSGGGGRGEVQRTAGKVQRRETSEANDEPIVIEMSDGTRIVSAVEGHSIESRADIDVSGDGVVSGVMSGRATTTDDDGTVRSQGHSTTAEASLEGASLTHGTTDRVGNTTRSSTHSLGRNADGVTTASTGRATTVVDGDVTTKGSRSASAGTDGSFSLGASRSQETDLSAEAGSGDYTLTNTTSAGLTGNVADGEIGANVGMSRNDGGVETSASASGSLNFDSSGRLEGAGAQVAMSSDGVSVTFGGGFTCSAQTPTQDGEEWVVTWVNGVTGSAGGGGKSGSRGLSGSITAGRTTTGSRRFSSRGASHTFFASGDWALMGLDDAGELGLDETLVQTDNVGGSVGASAKLGGLTVGGSLTLSGSTVVEVTGLGDQHVSVKLTESLVRGGSVSLSNGVLGMSFGGSVNNFHGAIVRFDLSTGAGDRAYDLFVEHGHVSRNGCELEANFTGETRASSSGVTALGASVASTSTTTDEHITYADGHTVDRQTGSESVSASIPLLGSYSESDSLTAQVDSSTNERTYSVTSTVNASSTGAVNRDLARSTGREQSGVGMVELANQSDRTWTVSSQFTEDDIQRLVEAARAGRFNSASLIYQSGHGREFVREISAAQGDRDRVDNALQHFIADTGDSGLALIRSTINVRPRQDLVLEGDPFMTGAAGHAALGRVMAQLETQAGTGEDLSALVVRINTTLTSQRERLEAISQRATYPDLPDSLRHEEVRRTRQEVERLEAMRGSVLERARAASAARRTDPERSVSSRTTRSAPVTEGASQSDARLADVEAEWQRMMDFEARVQDKRRETRLEGNVALHQEWAHDGAYSTYSARERFGGEGGWITSEGVNRGDYVKAESSIRFGRSQWTRAVTFEGQYDNAKAELEVTMATDPASLAGTLADRLGTLLARAHNTFENSRWHFENANNDYAAILAQHPGSMNSHFVGYGRSLPSSRRLN